MQLTRMTIDSIPITIDYALSNCASSYLLAMHS